MSDNEEEETGPKVDIDPAIQQVAQHIHELKFLQECTWRKRCPTDPLSVSNTHCTDFMFGRSFCVSVSLQLMLNNAQQRSKRNSRSNISKESTLARI